MNYPEHDTQYETLTVKKAEVQGDRWIIERSDGWTFAGCTVEDVKAAGLESVNPGDVIRFYGGLSRVRGVFINQKRIFYRTPAEEQQRHQQWLEDEKARRQKELDESRAERDQRRAALPPVFRERLVQFEQNNAEWRREFEPYELMVCEDAVKIATACGAPGKVQDFAKLSYEEQKRAVPNLTRGHSGNSFSCAVMLAQLYLSDPMLVVHAHGALCSLVGCDEYGHRPERESAT